MVERFTHPFSFFLLCNSCSFSSFFFSFLPFSFSFGFSFLLSFPFCYLFLCQLFLLWLWTCCQSWRWLLEVWLSCCVLWTRRWFLVFRGRWSQVTTIFVRSCWLSQTIHSWFVISYCWFFSSSLQNTWSPISFWTSWWLLCLWTSRFIRYVLIITS